MTSLRFEGGSRPEGPIARASDLGPGPSITRSNAPIAQSIEIVERRVDAFYPSFKGDSAPARRSDLMKRLRDAKDARSEVPVELAGARFVLSRVSREGRWLLSNDSADVKLEESAALRGWQLEINVRAQTLARIGHWDSLVFARRLARELLRRVEGERLRRFDLCADATGISLPTISVEQWLRQRRAKRVDKHITEHHDGSKINGWTIGREPILCRVYDKRAELLKPSPNADERRVAEESRWRAAGWNGDAEVTRVEFQVRGAALRQLAAGRMREPDYALEHLDEAWAYLSRRWLRLVTPAPSERRDRWPTDPRWEAIQGVVFDQQRPPAARQREQSHARARLVLSNLLGYGARTGLFEGIPLLDAEDVATWNDETTSAFIDTTIDSVFEHCKNGLRGELFDAYANRRVLVRHISEKINAAVARTSGVDDRLKANTGDEQ